jgi:hypothetical protein
MAGYKHEEHENTKVTKNTMITKNTKIKKNTKVTTTRRTRRREEHDDAMKDRLRIDFAPWRSAQ